MTPTPLPRRTAALAAAALTTLALATTTAPCGAQAAEAAQVAEPAALPPLQAVATLDLPRYMGTWYEVARYPNRFQRQCAGPASAQYALQADGTVQVTNRCPLADGRVDEAIGQARRSGPAGATTLEVRFAPAWLGWLPWVWGDYWVVDLDEAYTLSAVSEPQREYLWILSRQPQPDAAALQALLGRLQQRGLDPARLQWPVPAPAAAPVPLTR